MIAIKRCCEFFDRCKFADIASKELAAIIAAHIERYQSCKRRKEHVR